MQREKKMIHCKDLDLQKLNNAITACVLVIFYKMNTFSFVAII